MRQDAEARWLAAGALEVLCRPLPQQHFLIDKLSKLLSMNLSKESEQVSIFGKDWRLELVNAIAVALPDEELPRLLGPLLHRHWEPRLQQHAAAALHSVWARVAPSAWSSQASALGADVLAGARYWVESFAPEDATGAGFDKGGRYALAELLRLGICLPSPDVLEFVVQAVSKRAVVACPRQPHKLLSFLEHRYVCPITNACSPF